MKKLHDTCAPVYHIIKMLQYAIFSVGLITIILQWSISYYIERDLMWAIFVGLCAVYWLGVSDDDLH